VAVAGGVTYAVAEIGSGGVINGCYKLQNGQLRLIDPATDSCHPSETAISWSQTGPQGPAGPPGPAGPAGPPGPGTKTISGMVSSTGAVAFGTGFTSSGSGVGDYRLNFPAGTWSPFPAGIPIVVVTPFSAGGGTMVANVSFILFSSDGSASVGIILSSTAGSPTPIDGLFAFNASAPLTAGTSGLRSSGVRRVTLGKPVARSAARSRRGN
jgi:hypothetical protein